jgi:hypothetical protein
MLVAIFAHICEMIVGVRPSVRLFWQFHVLCPVNRQSPRLGGYYFQHRTKSSLKYIATPQPRQVGALEEGLGAGANRHPRAIDAADLRADGPHVDWEQDPILEPIFIPVLGRIRILAESGLTSMMVLHDYVSKRIAPIQERTCPTWLYTGVNDVTRLERGDRSTLGEEALALVMGKLSPNPSSHE